MPDELRHKLTIFDLMFLIGAAAFGAWCLAPYHRALSGPMLSVPVAAALTLGLIGVPTRTVHERLRQISRHPGTALCAGSAAVMLAVVIRLSIRAWFTSHVPDSCEHPPRLGLVVRAGSRSGFVPANLGREAPPPCELG